MVCGAHLFLLPVDAQAALERVVAAGRNGDNFSQLVWCRLAFHRLGIQDMAQFDAG
jgi:hypothetical protein